MAADEFTQLLSSLLEVSPKDEIIQYALTFQNKRDVQDYLESILGDSYSRKAPAVQRCMAAWRPENSNILLLDKFQEEDNLYQPRKTVKKEEKNNFDDNSIGTIPRKMVVTNFALSNPKKDPIDLGRRNHHQQQQSLQSEKNMAKKKSQKFVSLYTSDGKSRADEIMMLPGRHGCECAAQKHKLISNCLECGRIVCDQEGSGPCLFCGNLVCTAEEQEVLSRNSKTSEKLYKKLMKKKEVANDENLKGLEQARALKDKLVGFDRTSARRTKVIDDQADYFSAESKWLTQNQREEAITKEQKVMDKKHNSRKSRKYVLDFAGREVREDPSNGYFNPEDLEQDEENYKTSNETSKILLDPSLKIEPPVFVDTGEFDRDFPKVEKSTTSNKKSAMRLQDEEIQKVSDKGVCLSMHQPWATLLVKGIKKAEGRSWFSPHRGRLWIASTVKMPEPELIKSVEDFYKFIYKDEVVFPDAYPTGALLGCVDVADCLSHEEYQSLDNGHEENESEYVFMCENPQELFLKLPVKGKHKIWKLEQQMHKSAKSSLIH